MKSDDALALLAFELGPVTEALTGGALNFERIWNGQLQAEDPRTGDHDIHIRSDQQTVFSERDQLPDMRTKFWSNRVDPQAQRGLAGAVAEGVQEHGQWLFVGDWNQ